MIQIREASFNKLAEYAELSIAFRITTVLEVELVDNGLGGMRLTERPLTTPYTKNYDTLPGNAVHDWQRFDLTNWGMLWATKNGRLLGGTIIAYNTPAINDLDGRDDLALLWDLRVAPAARRQGIGQALLQAAESWASQRHCRQLKIETQNNNVAACRFYASQGYQLGGFNRFAYPDLPHETQLLWYKSLANSHK